MMAHLAQRWLTLLYNAHCSELLELLHGTERELSVNVSKTLNIIHS